MGGIFAQRMAGDKGSFFPDPVALRFENANDSHRHGHQRRLGIGGQGQRLLGALPHRLAQILAERGVHLLEDGSRLRERVGQVLAHADGL